MSDKIRDNQIKSINNIQQDEHQDSADAKRVMLVDEDGNPINDGNPMPIDAEFSGVLNVDLDGEYNVTINPLPDSTGVVAHDRNISPNKTHQTQRVTAKQGTTDTDVRALDVSLHDQNGNSYTPANPIPIQATIGIPKDTTGTTAHFNSTVGLASTPIPAVAGTVIASAYIENFRNAANIDLLVSFDGGVTFKTIGRDESLYVEPKGDITQIFIKGTNAVTKYEILLNRKP